MSKAFTSTNWVGMGLGAWLMLLPWAFDFSGQQVATLNALITGGVLIIEELAQRRPHPTLDFWIDHGTGIWLCVSPLLLGYPGLLPASMSMLVAGVITLALREQEHGWDEGHVPRR